MLIRTIEAPFWHQPVRLATKFKAWPAGAEGTMMGPPEVSEMQLGKDNVVVSYKLEVPIRMKGMARNSMIPVESLIILQTEEHSLALKID
jgi:hypothetical protein